MRYPDMNWRTMSALDLGAVEAIAEVVHKEIYESPTVLAERRRLYPNGAHLLEINERAVGYVLSHPWKRGTIPALNALLNELPPDVDTYYIHDLAVLPVARRVGAAKFVTAALEKHATARGFATLSLVAVNGSEPFWSKQGFVPLDLPELTGKLLSYEPSARYMEKTLG